MIPAALIEQARDAFASDLAGPPPLSLRGGNDVDSYRRPEPFDPATDRPTAEYLESHAFWGLAYLDARSWRHYIPQLIAYAERRPDDPRMAVEALVRSLRPPDRYPPRLATLSREQEAVVRAFLGHITADPEWQHLQADAQQALDEWWLPDARCRPTPDEIAAQRAVPLTYRSAGTGGYRLDLPEALTGGGVHDIPTESRRVEVWSGLLCGDAHTVVAVNVTPLSSRSLIESVEYRRASFRQPVSVRRITVSGASDARGLDGMVEGDSPIEPQTLIMVLASTATELVTLSVRSWPRDDLQREVEKIVASFKLIPGSP